MDPSRVAAIAARHRALEAAAHVHSTLDDAEAAAHLRQQIDLCWRQLEDECAAFCDAYNRAFGTDRLYCQPHADTIVVRSADDPQETVTITRTSPANPHGGHISAHRYSPHAAPVDLAIEGHVENAIVTLTCEGRPVTATDAVLSLLERFAEELARGTGPGARNGAQE